MSGRKNGQAYICGDQDKIKMKEWIEYLKEMVRGHEERKTDNWQRDVKEEGEEDLEDLVIT